MAAFSAIAAILAVVVFAAVLWPLWRESRGVVFGPVVVLVLAALATYKLVGTPGAPAAPAAAVDATPRPMEEADWQPEYEHESNPGPRTRFPLARPIKQILSNAVSPRPP